MAYPLNKVSLLKGLKEKSAAIFDEGRMTKNTPDGVFFMKGRREDL